MNTSRSCTWPTELSARKRWLSGSAFTPFHDSSGEDAGHLAASYAFGIARNHAFVDGNKRTALVVYLGFLRFNGTTITATREDRYLTFLGLAAGEITEAQMTEWLERYVVPLQPAPITK